MTLYDVIRWRGVVMAATEAARRAARAYRARQRDRVAALVRQAAEAERRAAAAEARAVAAEEEARRLRRRVERTATVRPAARAVADGWWPRWLSLVVSRRS